MAFQLILVQWNLNPLESSSEKHEVFCYSISKLYSVDGHVHFKMDSTEQNFAALVIAVELCLCQGHITQNVKMSHFSFGLAAVWLRVHP